MQDHRGSASASSSDGGGLPAPSGTPTVHRKRRRFWDGPIVVPPAKVDVGTVVGRTEGAALVGPSYAVGLHWASLSPGPTDIDIGVGYVGGTMFGGTGMVTGAGSPDGPAVTSEYDGAYLELGHTLESSQHFRTWLSGRAELLDVHTTDNRTGVAMEESHGALGLSARLSAELYGGGAAAGPGGAVLGSFAVGLYVEASHRDLGDAVGSSNLGAGITVRLPFMWLN